MRVHVWAQGHLRHFRPDGQERFTVDLPDGAALRQLIAASGIPWEEIGLVAVDGTQAQDDYILADGAHVVLLVPMEGG